jgi:hypothetical protein
MSNVEQSIAEWRKQMLAAGVSSPVPLEELQIHLHEEIERQLNLGCSEAEAFSSAAQKIGSPQTVQDEFKKMEKAEAERKWKESQIWLGAILGWLQLLVFGAILVNPYMTFGQRMAGLAAMAVSVLLVGVVGLNHRLLPVIPNRRTRAVIGFVAGVVPASIWVLVFGHFFLTGHEFPFGHYLVTLLWVSCPPLAVCLGLILGFETAARKKVTRASE